MSAVAPLRARPTATAAAAPERHRRPNDLDLLAARGKLGDMDAAGRAIAAIEGLLQQLVDARIDPLGRLGAQREDLLADARLTAFRAIRHYDPRRGRWTTHAGTWVKRRLGTDRRRYLSHARLPRRGDLDFTLPELRRPASLERCRDAACAQSAAIAERSLAAVAVAEILASLPALEAEVLRALWGLQGRTPESSAEIAARLRCSPSKVRRLALRALERVRTRSPHDRAP